MKNKILQYFYNNWTQKDEDGWTEKQVW